MPQPRDPGSAASQRGTLMLGLLLSLPAAAALWIAVDRLLPPIPGMATPLARLVFAGELIGVAVLLTFFTGIEAVAHERLASPAIDPLAGHDSRRLAINQRYVQHTLEQLWLFAPGLLMLAVLMRDGRGMRAVVATAVVWIVARWAFWIGYHIGPRFRAIGLVGMLQSAAVLAYCAGRFGWERGGWVGLALCLGPLVAIEIIVSLAARRPGAPASAGG